MMAHVIIVQQDMTEVAVVAFVAAYDSSSMLLIVSLLIIRNCSKLS